MDKIKIWITVDENKMITDYSLTFKENYIEIEVTEEPKDYLNWGLRNDKLVHYPKYADISTVYNNQGMTNLDVKKMVEYQRITEEEYQKITNKPLEEGELIVIR